MRRLSVVVASLGLWGCEDPKVAIDAPSLLEPDGPPEPPRCVDGGSTGENSTIPGDAALPYPTLRQLAVEWAITGDDNLDGSVTVRYRIAGSYWRQGAPLRRIPAGTVEGRAWANRHAGTLFDLEPGTAYEVELALRDPDGGCEIRTLTATTRAIPAPMPSAPSTAVTPATFATAAAAASPGDVLELGTGTYPGFTFTKDGAAGMPIVIRAATGAGVTIAGDVRLDGRSHVQVSGLLINGKIKFNGGTDLAITRNTITTTEDGITTKTRADNVYIADNTVIGATAWNEAALGVSGTNVGEGIEVTGPGHVIEHNRVRGFRDCISLLEDADAVEQTSIDIIGNDLSECADDAIEADFCQANCRIVGNRMTNVFIAMSSQPGLGGPTWFVRNVVYNALLTAFKFQRGSVGDLVIHNTVVKRGSALGIFTTDVFSRQYFRNNLFLGGPGGTYNTYDIGTDVIDLRAADRSVDLDHDGFGSTTGTFAGHIGAIAFVGLSELRTMTTEYNAVEINAATFAVPVTMPTSPFPALAPPDLRPAFDSPAIDTGVKLPGLNDGYYIVPAFESSVPSDEPDLGAYQLYAPLPVYGPR